jgi:2-polyprenyl-3-methyl-5-hydroxy-6-metoxy-1,4-benzoquinol methylase
MIDKMSVIKKRLGETWEPRAILDFASGYGCVARHLKNAFADKAVTTCDIHKDAQDFNQNVLGLQSIGSQLIPDELNLPKFDVIIALSFFSHVPKHRFSSWISQLSNALLPGGMFLFTANGHTTHRTICPHMTIDEDGVGFTPASEQKDLSVEDYGLTVSYPRYVFRILEFQRELRLSTLIEGFWWATQDTYIYT